MLSEEQRVIAELASRLDQTGAMLSSAIRSLMVEVAGDSCRPADLIQKLGLDKSMSSRLVQTARAESHLESLKLSPTPQGIGQTIEAASSHGVAERVINEIEAARDRFSELLSHFDGGKSDLEIIIRGLAGGDLRRDMLSAQQAIYRAMTQLHGCSVESHEIQTWYAPTIGDGTKADYCWSSSMIGLRRLRDTSPLILGGVYDREDPSVIERRFNLDGRPVGADLREWVVEDLSCFGQNLPTIRSDPPAQLLVLEPGAVPLLQRLHSIIAQRTVAGLSRYASDGDRHAQSMVLSRLPAKRVTIDFFVHEELGFGDPECRPVLNVLPLGMRIYSPTSDMPDRSEVVLDIDRIDPGWSGLTGYSLQVAQRMAAGASYDIRRFDRWRVTVQHPVPMVTIHTWFTKPEPPSGG